ncbi:hypothetical protein [Olivibacter sitiensis]|uniref:hypothetical protein n=1 Tax=Olivibacter sitiensis TaxID=376470 RepID=UPI000420B714|nr:hypothetical protein [Olivibacter sitiensis]
MRIKNTKNRTITSKFVSKLLVRLFVILLVLGVLPIFVDEQVKSNLEVTYVYIENKWVFIFPLILFLSFLTLLILAGRAKNEQDDLNWMLSLNTLLLIIYIVLLYVKLYPSIYGNNALM